MAGKNKKRQGFIMLAQFSNPALWKTVGLLVLSNCFMTYAWYGHLKTLNSKPLIVAVLISWAIAFFEYLIQVPANRIGHNHNIGLAQLKIMQEVITLTIFVPFTLFYMKERLTWNFLWAALCMVGAVYFIFRD